MVEIAKKKILIIDDEEELANSLDIRLKACGYEVNIANSGSVGLQKFKEVIPDLILLDVMMPDMDGIETLKRIREIDEKVPVIILTAYGTMKTALEAFSMNVVDHIAKPFDTKLLVEKIDSILKNK